MSRETFHASLTASEKLTRFNLAFSETQRAQMAAIKEGLGPIKLKVTYGKPVYDGYIVQDYQPHRGKK